MSNLLSPQHANHPELILDVRTPDEYLHEHIEGSVNVPLDQLTERIRGLDPQAPWVLSCRSGRRAQSALAQLHQLGFNNLKLLEGGIEGWKKAHKPVIKMKSGISILRQVQLVVGCMVLLGVFVKPLWLLAPLAGVGMLVAGATNTCLMATVLGKMPWNQIEGHTPPTCTVSSH